MTPTTFEHKPIEPIEAMRIPFNTDPEYATKHGAIVAWLLTHGCRSWQLEHYGNFNGISYVLAGWSRSEPGTWIVRRKDGIKFFPMSEKQMEEYYKVPGQPT